MNLNNYQLTIEVKNKFNTIMSQISGEEKVSISYSYTYISGDKVCFYASVQNKYLVIKLDDLIDETLVYAPDSTLEFVIPFGDEAVAYSPDAFKGCNHTINIHIATIDEIYSYRNLARNPLDQRGITTYYPHVTANFETRNEAIFAVRNTIDGIKNNKGHGIWPYESWGTGERDDAVLTLDFGRKVEVDKMILYLRADFPHDTYWNALTILFSDESRETAGMIKTADAQIITFNKRKVRWIKLTNLKMADNTSDFAALRQIEVYGTDCKLYSINGLQNR
ncbi:MAG TPA: carbohydrate-binding protein [Clostridiaceae bacterium]